MGTKEWVSLVGVAFAANVFAAEVVVKVPEGGDFQGVVNRISKIPNAKVLELYKKRGLIKADLPEQSAAPDYSNFKGNDIEYIVPNVKFHAFSTPNDPKYSSQWALEMVEASTAWDSKPVRKVVVAVVDTGVAWKHEDLKGLIWSNPKEIPGNGIDDDKNGYVDDVMGWDFAKNDNDPDDLTSSNNPGHGTHCAGIVGASVNNGKGIAGVATNVVIMPVRFLDENGSGDLLAGAKAIDYAIENGADVISASWGATIDRSQVTPILEAIERAEAKGVVFVVAAANDGASNDTTEVYPANAGYSNVISVAASDSSDQKPSWSNFGKHTVDIAAPGAAILSTLPANSYGNLSGTSMATPLVAGSVAFLIGQKAKGEISPKQVKATIQAFSDKVGIETACNCRIQLNSAVTAIKDESLVVIPNAASLMMNTEMTFSAAGGKGPYSYSVDNAEVATVNEAGVVSTISEGSFKLHVIDADGMKASSQELFVLDGNSKPAPPEDAACPYNGVLCVIMCVINPSLPWCAELPNQLN